MSWILTSDLTWSHAMVILNESKTTPLLREKKNKSLIELTLLARLGKWLLFEISTLTRSRESYGAHSSLRTRVLVMTSSFYSFVGNTLWKLYPYQPDSL